MASTYSPGGISCAKQKFVPSFLLGVSLGFCEATKEEEEGTFTAGGRAGAAAGEKAAAATNSAAGGTGFRGAWRGHTTKQLEEEDRRGQSARLLRYDMRDEEEQKNAASATWRS